MVKLTNCLERGCGAECCSNFVILTNEEAKSGQYQIKRMINPKDGKQFWTLKQGLDLKCVYLGKDFKCSIYEKRPESCQDWTCDDDEVVRL